MKALSLALVVVISCGPQSREPGNNNGDVDAGADAPPDEPMALITGRVFAPNHGPGQVPPGQEIPIAGALVYISDTRPAPIPDGVFCEACVATPNGGTLTTADGSFELVVSPGPYYLVIQKGQFRIEHEMTFSLGTTALPPNVTTLQAQWNPAMGIYMPRVAMAQGTNDSIEDILAKLGFGTLSGNGFGGPVGENGQTELAIYQYAGVDPGSVTYLLQNLDEMRKYHILFFPCATSMSSLDNLLRDQTVLANLRRYVNEGGKLYVTDWSGELADRAFPPQIELGDTGADSTGTYDPVTFTGTLATIGDSNGGLYTSPDAKAVDPGLRDWLGLQTGPSENGSVGMYNPDNFIVTDIWNWIRSLNAVQLGVDDQDLPVYDTPKAWVTGTKPNQAGGQQKPLAVTYQPTGCGKVLYTAFQTSSSKHQGLYPQERVLMYLIMEIQTCSDNPIF
jgi:hypothetical protein